MACIGCTRIKTKDMEDKIKQLRSEGKNINQIAAMLMIHKAMVIEALEAPTPIPTPKKSTKKTIIEDEQL